MNNRSALLASVALSALLLAMPARAADTLGLLEAGRLDSAIAVLELELGNNPYDPVALNNLAVARARGGEAFSALDLLDRASRLAAGNRIIESNRDALRDWIARRIDAGNRRVALQAGTGSALPAPPALWAQ